MRIFIIIHKKETKYMNFFLPWESTGLEIRHWFAASRNSINTHRVLNITV